MSKWRIAYLQAALVVMACVSCTSARPAAHPSAATLSPGPLRKPSSLAHDFQWHQRVTAIYPKGKSSFEAALQHRGGVLTLVGLSPMGMPGFVITLDGNGHVSMDNRSGTTLPFEASYIVADVERVFFPWLATPAPNFDGSRAGDVLGLKVHETFRKGVLYRREFTRDDAPSSGRVAIEYKDWRVGDDAPQRVVLDNEWFGYQLIIETVSQSRL